MSLAELLDDAKARATPATVWPLYAKAELMSAVLKFRLGVERPGVFLDLPRSEEPDEFLPMALDHLRKSIPALEAKRLLDGLESIRGTRTCLRAYLASKRRIAMRVKRRTKSAAVRVST